MVGIVVGSTKAFAEGLWGGVSWSGVVMSGALRVFLNGLNTVDLRYGGPIPWFKRGYWLNQHADAVVVVAAVNSSRLR